MAAVVWSNYKAAFRYSVAVGNESTTRTINGLNSSNTGSEQTGPGINFVLGALITTINSLSSSSVTNPRYLTEMEVTM